MSALLLCGCATSKGGSLGDRFVKPGKPAVDLGGPAAKTDSPRREREKAARLTAEASSHRSSSFSASAENSDPGLSRALLAETLLPTAENHLRVALEYKRLGILDLSANHLSLALQKAPRMAEAHESLARIWRDWGFPDNGLGAAYRATYYAPQSSSAENTLGTLLDALGRTDDARRAYERALALDPMAAWALNNLCDLERRSGRLSEARARCEEALGIDPTLVAAHNNLALTFAASGDLVAAREAFLAAGDVAAADYNLGMVHLAEREYASAADSFEAAIHARPAFTAAKTRAHAARLYLLTGGK